MDPDVILVGELRDLETIEAALRAAETGHLVFGTLHTNSAQGTVTRIVDQFPVNQQEQIRIQLAGSLVSVLCQTLMPRSDTRGRIAAFEFMVVTPAIQNLIRDNKTFRIPSSIQTGKKHSMQLMDDHIFRLFKEGKIEEAEALDHSHNAGQMRERIDAFRKGQTFDATEPDVEEPQAPPSKKTNKKS
jgi:twitching motility protein PilT